MTDLRDLKRDFQTAGVVKLPGLLSADSLAAARRCYDWSLGNPGPNGAGSRFMASAQADNFEDKANPDAPSVYADWLRSAPLADASRALWDSKHVWFMYEQVFRKSGEARRTFWHQDSSYLAVDGSHLIVFWISFQSVPESESLEFVRGSHRGVLYDGSTFNDDDPTEPMYGTGALPRLPNVDADPAVAADRLDHALFEHAEQLGLQRHRHLGDFVKKKGAAVSSAEDALVRGRCTGESTLLMAEQDGFKHIVGNGCAIHRDKRCLATLRMIMDKSGEDLFAGARRPVDEDGDICLCNTAGQAQKVTAHLITTGNGALV